MIKRITAVWEAGERIRAAWSKYKRETVRVCRWIPFWRKPKEGVDYETVSRMAD